MGMTVEEYIRWAQKTGATQLNLSGNQLTSLPPEIKLLKKLTTLDLSNNQLTSMPTEIKLLKKLTTLKLHRNQLTALPPEIKLLKQLTTLDLSNNQLTSLPPEIAQLKQLTTLDLSNNQLTSMPPEIAQLKQLTTLNLSGNQLTSMPTEIKLLKKLTTLNLTGNQLTSLPPEIAQLKQLTTLDLSNNQLTSMPPEIAQLKQLTTLNLSGNQLTSMPTEIKHLKQLTTLILIDNQLTSLPTEIKLLKQLTTLILSGNQLTSMPTEIKLLKKLTALGLSDNQLTSMPPEIKHLKQLTTLSLSGNQLTSMPPEIKHLKQLTTLNLTGNQLTSLPPEIAQLKQLTELYLHGNQGLGISDEILGPTYVDVLIDLYLDQDLSPTPPTQILDYYFRSLRETKKPLLEAKVLVVGQGAVGKTSLVKRLVHDEFDKDEEKTEGIDIVRWQVPGHADDQIRVNIWDFGGQEIMHATHQFFLTRRSLYLLVLDARKGEGESNLHYWLRIIQSFGADSPVLVVVNKHEPPNELELNETRLRKDFAPNIKGFFNTSCKDGEGIEALQAAITREIRALEHVYDTVPLSFFNAKAEIEGATAQSDYLEADAYADLCTKHGIESEGDQALLLRFLHDLGSVLHFSDEDRPEFRLEDKHILNPEWVTGGVYRILNSSSLKEAHGVLKRSEVGRILRPEDGYLIDRQIFILGMMRKFELCFDFPGGKELLVAELLAPNEPELDFDDEEPLRFEYHYEVLPEGVLPRFIVRNHHHLHEVYWRTGVQLKLDGNRVVVRADLQQHKIFVSVLDGSAGRRRALAAVRVEFQSIHRSLPGLDVEERVPLPNQPEVTVSYKYLQELEQRGKDLWLFEGAREECSVRELLAGVMEPTHPSSLERYEGGEATLAGKGAARRRGLAPPQIIQNQYNFHDRAQFQQVHQYANVDLGQLTSELAQLKTAMLAQASKPEHFKAIAEVVEAEQAAAEGDKSKTIEGLKKAGKWVLDVGEKLALKTVETVVKTAMSGGV